LSTLIRFSFDFNVLRFRSAACFFDGRTPEQGRLKQKELAMRCYWAKISFFIFLLGAAAGCTKQTAVRHSGDTQPAAHTAVAIGDAMPKAQSPGAEKEAPWGIEANIANVSLAVRPQFGVLHSGTSAPLNILFEVEGLEPADVIRQPLDLAVVIDRSGSMSGDKIVSVKSAALTLLKSLGPEDRVTLISYASNIQIHAAGLIADKQGIDMLRNEILSISADGNTALGPATFEALSILEESRKNGDSARLTHIMLLSDGIANTGISDPETIGKRAAAGFEAGVSLSTLGVGLDYNEDLMTHLADQGGGQYHFIQDDQEIVAVLQDEFNGLTAQVAREMVLSMDLMPGVTAENVFGYPMVLEGSRATVRIGGLRAHQTRDIVIGLNAANPTGDEMRVGTFTLTLRDVADGQHREWRGDLVLGVSSDENRVAASELTDVTVRVAEVESAREMTLAARAVDKGDFQQAEMLLDNSIQILQKKAAKTGSKSLKKQIQTMESAKTDLSNAKQSRVAQKSFVKSNKSKAYKKSKQSSRSKKKSGKGNMFYKKR
jgi:Ca-activated chloride channel homolog